MAKVPSANFGISNTPIGPFQTTSFAAFSTSLNFSMIFGPMSMHAPARGHLVDIHDLAVGLGVELVGDDRIDRQQQLAAAFAMMVLAVSTEPASTRLSCML